MISALPVSGAWQPKMTGAHDDRPRISFSSDSLSAPWPCPPSSGSRCVAHRPWSRTCCLSGSMIARTCSDGGVNGRSPPKTMSSGSTSSRTKPRAQSSFRWYSGSVSKSHAIGLILPLIQNDSGPRPPSDHQRAVAGPVTLAQQPLVELAVRLPGKLVGEVHGLRALVGGEVLAAVGQQVRLQLRAGRPRVH